MNAPDPKANTTTEAYLAYKAGYLEESELKPKLYEPYLHFDAWLAYWAGLTTTYPVTISKKNLFDISKVKTSLTFLVNNGDGTLTVNAPSTSSSVSSAPPNKLSDFCPDLKVGDTAVLSMQTTGSERYIYLYGTGANVPWTVGTSKTITQALLDAQVLWYASGVNTSATISNIQLELGTTSSEYEPYSTPEMLTDEEALVAYLSGVTDTYPEEIKDPYDVRIVGYLKHLASVRWPEPDYPVNNEEFYLSTMEPTHTSNSEPSADIELDTAEGKIISVEVYGDTKQTTYTGKNLVDYITNKTADGGGITISVGSDGIFAVTGVPSVNFKKIVNNFSIDSILEDGATYTVSKTEDINLLMPQVVLYNKSTGTNTYINVLNTTSESFVVDKTTYSYQFSAQTYTTSAWGEESRTVKMGFMLEKSATATAFEPYVGGVPSPNPDYPQDVNVVTGRQQINVSGKNLLDTEYSKVKNIPGNTSSGRTWDDTEKTMEYNGITYKFNENGTITVTGSTGSAPSSLILSGPIENLQEGSEYYMSGCPDGGSAARYSLRLYTTASTYTAETGNGLIFTYGEQPFIRINISAGIVADDLVFKPMIVNSSDAGDEFVPFQGYESYEINLGKNLLDASTNVEGKRLDASGNLINDGEYFTTDFIKVSPSTKYTYSRYASGGGSTALCTWKADGTFIERIWWGGVNNIPTTSFSFTTGPDVGLVKICDIKTLNTLQLELGSTSSSYAPYSTPIELCKIGDHQDYIYKNGDGWYVHKECDHIQLDANIYGILQDGTAGVNEISYAGAFYVLKGSWNTAGGDYDNDAANARLSSNFGKYREQTISGNGAANSMVDGTFCQRSTNDRVYMRFSTLAGKTGNEVKSILQEQGGTNFYYYLNTPSDTQITDSTLIAQLDALADADTYNGKTYIKIVANAPNLPALLSVEAYKY